MKTILLLEDDENLNRGISLRLEKEGYRVLPAFHISQARRLFHENEVSLIISDITLPDGSGLDFGREVRKSSSVYLIFLTALNQEIDIVSGYDIGADDYITKPFQLLELRARIQAVVRRFHGRTNPVITIGELSINPATRTAAANGVPILLAPKEFDILEYLAQKHPAVTTAEEVAEHIYDENFDPSSSILRVHFSRLKRKLADGCGREILQNIRGKGYWLCEKQS